MKGTSYPVTGKNMNDKGIFLEWGKRGTQMPAPCIPEEPLVTW